MTWGEQIALFNSLCELKAEQVVRAFTDYHGMQLLDEGFRKHLQDEELMEER